MATTDTEKYLYISYCDEPALGANEGDIIRKEGNTIISGKTIIRLRIYDALVR